MEQLEIELPKDLTIAHVEAFKIHALPCIEDAGNILIIDKQLNKIDTVGVQLLLSIISQILSQKKSLTWQNNSSILIESIKQLGLENSDFKNYLFN
ncbi:MAG: STAS domain-containing protein [Thalassotalea sp.]